MKDFNRPPVITHAHIDLRWDVESGKWNADVHFPEAGTSAAECGHDKHEYLLRNSAHVEGCMVAAIRAINRVAYPPETKEE